LFRLFIISALLIARAHPSPSPTATPSLAPENPAITAIARHEFVAVQVGVIDKNHYSPEAAQALTADAVDNMSKALSSYGALVKTEWLGTFLVLGAPAGVTGYTYKMDCSAGSIYEQLMIGPDGKIDSIDFRKTLGKESPAPG